MSEFTEKIKERTKSLAIKTIILSRGLPVGQEGWTIQKQIIRSSSSVAANYRAVARSRSTKEFYSKICIVIEELDETIYWLELIKELGHINGDKIDGILIEMNELFSILNASKKTLMQRLSNS